MLTLDQFRVITYSAQYLDIEWVLSATDESESDYTIYLDRSGAERGPWEYLTPSGLKYRYSFRDGQVNQLSRIRDYWYQLRIINDLTGEIGTYGPVRLEQSPDLIALEIARRNAVNLQVNSGERCLVYKRKRGGARCTECYDPVLEHSISECRTCYNTGWVGGYERPIRAWMNIVPQAKNLMQTEAGDQDTVIAQAGLANYPIISPRDLVIDTINRRWRVISPVQEIKKRGWTIKQSFGLELISPGQIEYQVPVRVTAYDTYPGETQSYERTLDSSVEAQPTQHDWQSRVQKIKDVQIKAEQDEDTENTEN